MQKSLTVGDTVWALWPGSRKYYEATVLDVGKTTAEVDFKDGFKTEVALRQIYVSVILKLRACCPYRLLNYKDLKQIAARNRNRPHEVTLRTFRRRHFGKTMLLLLLML